VKIGSLFAGIGGFDLAARWMGWETKWYSEIDPYACRVMERHFGEVADTIKPRLEGYPRNGKSGDQPRRHDTATDNGPTGKGSLQLGEEDVGNTYGVVNIGGLQQEGEQQGGQRGASGSQRQRVVETGSGAKPAYNVRDIREWTPGPDDTVDVVCGGFPCQPVSLAGKRKAQDDKRWLWPEFARVLGVLRPRFVVIENVAGLRSRGMDDVLRDLAKIGYDAEWTSLSAADVGAPHKRERVWIVAYPRGDGRLRGGGSVRAEQQGTRGDKPDRRGSTRREQRKKMADTNGTRQKHLGQGDARERRWTGWDAPAGDGWWNIEPGVGRVAHGIPARVDRLRGLGNAIVPQCAYEIFKQIAE
jgi:DNA (cytosine-5)-methyltransferase 1